MNDVEREKHNKERIEIVGLKMNRKQTKMIPFTEILPWKEYYLKQNKIAGKMVIRTITNLDTKKIMFKNLQVPTEGVIMKARVYNED